MFLLDDCFESCWILFCGGLWWYLVMNFTFLFAFDARWAECWKCLFALNGCALNFRRASSTSRQRQRRRTMSVFVMMRAFDAKFVCCCRFVEFVCCVRLLPARLSWHIHANNGRQVAAAAARKAAAEKVPTGEIHSFRLVYHFDKCIYLHIFFICTAARFLFNFNAALNVWWTLTSWRLQSMHFSIIIKKKSQFASTASLSLACNSSTACATF